MRRPILGSTMLALALLAACGDDKGTTGGVVPSTPSTAVNTTPVAPKTDAPGTSTTAPTDDPSPVLAKTPEIRFAPTRADATPWNPQDGASVTGVAKLMGEKPPRRKKVPTDKDPKCTEEVREEGEVVSKEMQVKNVFVVVVSGHEKLSFSKPEAAVKIDQKGCHYEPHIFGMMAGQKIEVTNSDDTTHNIHGLPKKSKEFNFTQPRKGQVDNTTLENAENAVTIKCDIHPWMGAYAFVLPHLLFSVTQDNGSFEIKGLPDGEYELLAWHEVYGEQRAKVSVKDMKAEAVTFTFEKK